MKYLYPFECENLKLSTPSELQAAIDGNRREARRPTYSFEYPSLNNSQSFSGIGFNHSVSSVNPPIGLIPSRLFPPIFHSTNNVTMNTPFEAASMLAAAFQRHQQINSCFPHISPPFLNFTSQPKSKIENLKVDVENTIDPQNRILPGMRHYIIKYNKNIIVGKSYNSDLSNNKILKESSIKQSYSPELTESSNQIISTKSFTNPQMSTDYQADSSQILTSSSNDNNLLQKPITDQSQKSTSNHTLNVCTSSGSITNYGKITNISGRIFKILFSF